jgi:hypothetical protein
MLSAIRDIWDPKQLTHCHTNSLLEIARSGVQCAEENERHFAVKFVPKTRMEVKPTFFACGTFSAFDGCAQ